MISLCIVINNFFCSVNGYCECDAYVGPVDLDGTDPSPHPTVPPLHRPCLPSCLFIFSSHGFFKCSLYYLNIIPHILYYLFIDLVD